MSFVFLILKIKLKAVVWTSLALKSYLFENNKIDNILTNEKPQNLLLILWLLERVSLVIFKNKKSEKTKFNTNWENQNL